MTRPFQLFGAHPIVARWLRNSPRFWRMLICCLSGGIAILLVTFICFRLRLTLATPALLYLVVIVLLSLYGSLVLSAAFSLIGVACLDYFFTPPVFSFRVDDPFNIVAILVFLTVSVVITGLVSRVQETMERQFEMRLEERVDERTRIARELHDTLLQSFNGLLLRFSTVHALFSKSPDQALTILENAIDETRQALTEGRQTVQGLRSSAVGTHEFSEAIKTLTEELASNPAHSGGAEVRLNVEGTPRKKQPLIRDEIYRIASEALRNAFRHAEATRIEVHLSYHEKSFEVRVRDDGKGIDPKVLTDEGRAGHFGLRGMRERAEQIGGKLTVWSAPGSGTELVLSVPGAIAYDTAQSARRSWLPRRIDRES